MDKPNILILAVFLVFLAVQPRINSQWVPRPITSRPLCATELAVASRACSLLPLVPGHPPSPPPPSAQQADSHWYELEHRHRMHRHEATPQEEDCCRWLGAIDSECVCDLLVYLPPFLSRPLHQYTVVVEDSCNVTYLCGSRIKA
ncbi:hypothetical protein ACH5RR_010685 [Cinchona calisaya]|uniref:Bifunctional inhibitor/plant lipid transfer protein/seed storage helical domain-containing protein n=1 Tax=Cinchona calisaya TaxID=153742 RepID=A0ABD3AJR9_9GENT